MPPSVIIKCKILVLCFVAYKQLRSLFSVHQNTVWRVHSMFLYIARLPENSLRCCDMILCRVLSSSHKETCSCQQTDLTHNATHNACRTAWHFDENGSLIHWGLNKNKNGTNLQTSSPIIFCYKKYIVIWKHCYIIVIYNERFYTYLSPATQSGIKLRAKWVATTWMINRFIQENVRRTQ